ncbi:MAG: MaoC family dehydratase N-terminal domain-containing protein [Mycobacterium sp.]|nr:MaoC family dehydratase N-terminal domain-containing protein [Mycobacterium sp.]
MALDPSAIGTQLPAATMTVDRAGLRFFAKAIGEADPVYTDVDAARAAGHPDLPVPPTFLFSIELEAPDPFAYLAALNIDLRYVLHGEQSFIYHAMAYPGDQLVATPRITDVYTKKGGALDFIAKDTAVTRADGTAIADLQSLIVIRNAGGTA